MKHRWPWRRLVVIGLSAFAIGNSSFTLILYLVGMPELTAWTGHVPQSTPSAVNDLCLGIVVMIVGLYQLRNE